MFFNSLIALTATDGTQTTGSMWPTLLMIGGLVLVFYFFMIRPQKKQESEVRNMRDNLVVGDEITTIGGILGRVVKVTEETVVIETSREHNKLHIRKDAIRSVDVHAADTVEAAEKAEKAEK